MEKVTFGLGVAGLGMIVVFVGLLILIGFITVLGLASRPKKPKAAPVKQAAPDVVAAPPVQAAPSKNIRLRSLLFSISSSTRITFSIPSTAMLFSGQTADASPPLLAQPTP